jgi:ankyrin repeat protein
MKDVDGIKKLVERDPEATPGPVDVNIIDDLGCTPLIWSARVSDVATIQYLVSKGADIEHVGFGGLRAIHHVANTMHEASIHALVEAGADVNAVDEVGNTALIYISARGLLSGTSYLLEKGANLDQQNNAGSTAFHKACNTGQLQVPQKFVELKCNLNMQDEQGNTGVHLAARGAHAVLLRFLMSLPDAKRPDLSIKNKDGKTAADCALGDDIKEILNGA